LIYIRSRAGLSPAPDMLHFGISNASHDVVTSRKKSFKDTEQ